MLISEIENGACYCSVESTGSRFYHNPSLPPSINVGGSGKASDNIPWINIALGERGSPFLLNQTKCVNIFSRIVDPYAATKYESLGEY